MLNEPEAWGWGVEDTGAPRAPSKAAGGTTGAGGNRQQRGPEARQVLPLLS